MSDTVGNKTQVQDETDLGPPDFEEMPAWFQEEINHKNDSRGFELDGRESHARTFKRNLLILSATYNVVIIWLTSNSTWGGLFLMAGAGALVANLSLRFEASQPKAILFAGVCNLPIYFFVTDPAKLTGLDAAPYFFTCLLLLASGVMISQTISGERTERLPF